MSAAGPPIERLVVSAYRIPTDAPESDGTLTWDATTLVVVEAHADRQVGVGYTYNHAATARVVKDTLAPLAERQPAFAVRRLWEDMVAAVRNLGSRGIAASAIAAVDSALWDLEARLLGLPLVTLLGPVHEKLPVYGSGGFTSYAVDRLQAQLAGWAEAGFQRVKMKVGRDPGADPERVRRARKAVGRDVALFVDANGAYTRKEALRLAERFAEQDVRWFEEPVSSDDLEGLRLLRDRAPASMEVAAGEYGWDLPYFGRMMDAGAVDVIQADVTRCLGITGLLQVGALCRARGLPLSCHTAHSLHLHPALALTQVVHLEYFHDHARIEELLFEGAPRPVSGTLAPDLGRPGNGLSFKRNDAERYAT